MFRVLLWKEIREHLMTFRFGAALVTTFVLVVISVWVLGDDYIRRRDNYNRLVEEASRSVAEVTVPSMLIPVVHYPPSALSIFARGDSKYLGNSVQINRWEVPREASDSLTDNLLLASKPSFDLLAIFTLIVSLFGVLLTYDALSGERERGTLRLVCSFRLSRGAIFATKFSAGVITLSLPFVVSFISALIVLQFVHGIGLEQVQWLAVGAMLFTGLLYGALFIAIGLLCSALFRRSSTALVLSLLIWALGVLLVPAAATNVAGALHRLPPPAEITSVEISTIRDMRQRLRDIDFPEYEGDIWVYGINGVIIYQPVLFDGNPKAFHLMSDRLRVGEPLYQERAETIWNTVMQHEAAMTEQAELADRLSSLAPAYQLRKVFSALAGTDYASYYNFMEYARRYRREFLDQYRQRGLFDENILAFFSRRAAEEAFSEENWEARFAEYQAIEESGERTPTSFSHLSWDPLPPGLLPTHDFNGGGPRFESALWPIASLAFITALAFALGFVAFIRYDVR